MDFSDETYVRLYTRKTLTWHQLGWEGRVVERAMLGEFDEAGLFAIRGDAAACVSMVTELPIDLVRIGLQRLVETDTWMVTARVITWPTYEEAQNCRRSDRVRQRESRRARTAQSVTDVTTGHTPSQLSPLVTASHPPSLCSLPPSAPSAPSDQTAHRAPAPVGAKLVPEPEPPSSPTVTEIRLLPPSKRERTLEAEAASLPDAPSPLPRVYTMPCEEPPQDYLDEAVMRSVHPEQARATWRHYWTEGLPKQGVERLYAWLLERAKGFAIRNAGVQARAGPRRRGSAQQDHGVDPLSFHRGPKL